MIWIALAFCLVAILGSLVLLATRVWRLWRTIRATSKRATEAVENVMTAATRAEKRAVAVSANAERLSGATARLQVALAELAAIRAAASEPQDLLARVRGVVPRK